MRVCVCVDAVWLCMCSHLTSPFAFTPPSDSFWVTTEKPMLTGHSDSAHLKHHCCKSVVLNGARPLTCRSKGCFTPVASFKSNYNALWPIFFIRTDFIHLSWCAKCNVSHVRKIYSISHVALWLEKKKGYWMNLLYNRLCCLYHVTLLHPLFQFLAFPESNFQ